MITCRHQPAEGVHAASHTSHKYVLYNMRDTHNGKQIFFMIQMSCSPTAEHHTRKAVLKLHRLIRGQPCRKEAPLSKYTFKMHVVTPLACQMLHYAAQQKGQVSLKTTDGTVDRQDTPQKLMYTLSRRASPAVHSQHMKPPWHVDRLYHTVTPRPPATKTTAPQR